MYSSQFYYNFFQILLLTTVITPVSYSVFLNNCWCYLAALSVSQYSLLVYTEKTNLAPGNTLNGEKKHFKVRLGL